MKTTKKPKWLVCIRRIIVEQSSFESSCNDPAAAVKKAMAHEYEERGWRRVGKTPKFVISVSRGLLDYDIDEAEDDGFRGFEIAVGVEGLEGCDAKKLDAKIFERIARAEEEALRIELENGGRAE